jgi:hypothetical protein
MAAFSVLEQVGTYATLHGASLIGFAFAQGANS